MSSEDAKPGGESQQEDDRQPEPENPKAASDASEIAAPTGEDEGGEGNEGEGAEE